MAREKPERIIVLQPVVPLYRDGLFARLAEYFGAGFSVYASQLNMGALTGERRTAYWEHQLGSFQSLGLGLEWQNQAISIAISRGDIVIVSGNPRNLSTLLFLVKAKFKGVKCLWWGHLWSSTSKPWRAKLRMLVMLLVDGLIFYTDNEILEYRSSILSRSKMPVFALNNGIETSDIIRFRLPYRSKDRANRILFIGRLTEKADLTTLLLAIGRPGCEFLELDVIGGGPAEAGAKRLATNIGLARRVRWHGEIVDEWQIAEIANLCKVFVYPGSVGLSLIHGLAFGLPCVVHDDRKAHGPEFAALQNNINGCTFRRGDQEDLSHTLLAIISNLQKLDIMSEAAISTTASSFNTEDMAKRFIRAIQVMREA